MIFPSLILNIERWKYNKEYEVYVSNLGHFKDKKKKNLPIKINEKGYCLVKTSVGFKCVHRVVMLTWKPISNAEEITVDHLDHNKRNNALKNLEWVTFEENQTRAKRDKIVGTHYENINLTINGIRFETFEDAWEIMCSIYPAGYPKSSLRSAIKDLTSGKNNTGAKKLGKSATLKIIKQEKNSYETLARIK